MTKTRDARVAGQFYPAQQSALIDFLSKHVDRTSPKRKVTAVIMPHAGYVYSGTTAALTISHVAVPDTVLLIGPNHTGYGTEFSLMAQGTWRLPLGDVSIDESLSQELLKSSSLLLDDDLAHMHEHSLEVEIPFLYFLNNKVKIVPLTVATNDLNDCRKVGEAIGDCVKGKNVLLVASTDMTHYESQASAERKDKEAIDAVLKLDENQLAAVVSRHNISMCGYIPVYITLIAAKRIGAQSAQLIDYRTSGEAFGDYKKVVGYAGFIIE